MAKLTYLQLTYNYLYQLLTHKHVHLIQIKQCSPYFELITQKFTKILGFLLINSETEFS